MNALFRAFLLLAAVAWNAASLAAAPVKIGVLLKGSSNFWVALEEGLKSAAHASGAEVIARRPNSEMDVAGQIKLLGQFEPEGISALILAPCSSTELTVPVAALVAKGIKVVVVDSPLDLDTPCYIATNHTDAGVAAGQLLASLVHDGDEVSILRHTLLGGATLLRESSAYATLLAAHHHLRINRDIYAGAVAGDEEKYARELLRRQPNTQGILASSTTVTMAMLNVLQASGRAGSIKFVGFGFNLNPAVVSALESGTMSGWIAQSPAEIAHRAIAAALALVKGESVPEVIYCPFVVVTRANLHTSKVQELLGSN